MCTLEQVLESVALPFQYTHLTFELSSFLNLYSGKIRREGGGDEWVAWMGHGRLRGGNVSR